MLVKVGGFLATAGLISIALQAINFELRILMWIDIWGTSVGWAIRIAMVVLGALLFGVGKLTAPKDAPAA